MIGKLRGTIDSVREGHAILDVNGVGYMVFAASSTLGQLEQISGEVSLVIETHVREDHIHLYGFLTEADRSWFTLLTTVQGVGAKMALSIQTCFEADELTTIIAAQDKTAITRAKGVGAKVGERIITELKNKVANMPAGAAADFGVKHSGATKPATSKAPANCCNFSITAKVSNCTLNNCFCSFGLNAFHEFSCLLWFCGNPSII